MDRLRPDMLSFVEWAKEDHGPRVAKCGQDLLDEGMKFEKYTDFLVAAYEHFDKKHPDPSRYTPCKM